MPIHQTPAIVLKKYNFRETSLIVNFYTRDFGKLSGILKGIRKEPAKFASTLELFSYNDIIFYRSRSSSLHLVSQCDLKDNYTMLRQNMFKIGAASIIIELIDILMREEDKNEEIFNLGLVSLKELENTDNPEKVMTIFKIKVLSLSGFKPNFDSCVSCNSRVINQSKFSLRLGGLLCARCYKKDFNTRSIFRGTIASILHIQKNDFKTNLNLGLNPQIKKELELILNSFLRFHLEKDIKSEKILNALGRY
ncbi:MAG: DNA repair protein RecO [Candidatus Omnitrophota bacterium]